LVYSRWTDRGHHRQVDPARSSPIFWTIVLGIIGSIIGGAVTHMFVPPRDQRFHPAGLIFSTLGAILVLFVCYKLKIRFPHM
jgi:uncharacterized membrane protein YeaQ/YmgE (transglycosylase-associated protein family)